MTYVFFKKMLYVCYCIAVLLRDDEIKTKRQDKKDKTK